MKSLLELLGVISGLFTLAIPTYFIGVNYGPSIGWSVFFGLALLYSIEQRIQSLSDLLYGKDTKPVSTPSQFDKLTKLITENHNDRANQIRNTEDRVMDFLVSKSLRKDRDV